MRIVRLDRIVDQRCPERETNDTQEVASAASRELKTLRSGKLQKTCGAARQKQTVAAKEQPENVVVKDSIGRYGQKVIERKSTAGQ